MKCANSVCSRIAVFSITVLHDERIVVVAEQRPDSTEEDSFQWMSRVLQVRSYFDRIVISCCSSLFLAARLCSRTSLHYDYD